MDVLQSYQLVNRLNLVDCSLQYRLMEECFKETKNHSQSTIHNYCEIHLIRGELKGIEALLKDNNSVSGLELMGMLCFLQNRNDESLFFYASALKQLKKETRKRNIILDDFPGYFYHLALLRDRSIENHNLLKKHLEIAIKDKGHDQKLKLPTVLASNCFNKLIFPMIYYFRPCYFIGWMKLKLQHRKFLKLPKN
jgi:hypothetical protein